MIKFYFFFIFILSLVFAKILLPKDISIVAQVNDEIITNVDLDNRLSLALIISRLPNDEEIKKRLKSQILRVLIEERLKIQEANRLGIYTTTEEVLTEINNLEAKLKLETNSLIKSYGDKNVPEITILNQMRSSLLWRKLLYATVIKNFKVSEIQLEEAVESYIKTSGGIEYNFSEIFISFIASDEEETRKKIQSIVSKVTPDNFSLLAEQFSDGAVIYENNNTNWTRESILTEEVKEFLSNLEIGNISKPYKGPSGYHIYLINDKRKTKKIKKNQIYVDLSQIYFKLNEKNKTEKINYYTELLDTMREVINGCADLEKGIEETSEAIGGKMGIVNKKSIEQDFIEVLEGLEVGKLSDVTISSNGIHALMLCSPVIENSLDKLKQSIESKIRYSKINNSSQLYMNRIKKRALIEIKNFNY